MKILILLIAIFSSAIHAGEGVTRFELMQFEKNCINSTSKEHQEWCSKNSWMLELIIKNTEAQAERELRQYNQ